MVAIDEGVWYETDDRGVLLPDAGGVKWLGVREPYRFFFGRRSVFRLLAATEGVGGAW